MQTWIFSCLLVRSWSYKVDLYSLFSGLPQVSPEERNCNDVPEVFFGSGPLFGRSVLPMWQCCFELSRLRPKPTMSKLSPWVHSGEQFLSQQKWYCWRFIVVIDRSHHRFGLPCCDSHQYICSYSVAILAVSNTGPIKPSSINIELAEERWNLFIIILPILIVAIASFISYFTLLNQFQFLDFFDFLNSKNQFSFKNR